MTALKQLVKSAAPPAAWGRLARARWAFDALRAQHGRDAAGLGRFAAATLVLSGLVGRSPGVRRETRPLWPLWVRGYRHPVYYREGISDAEVVRQVFAHEEYGCVANDPDVRYVVDCGANIGATAFYLLHKHPRAKVAAVEPDPDNLRVLRRTLAPFADRVTVIPAGVWSASVPLVVERGTYRDGYDWSVQVRPARPGEQPDLLGRTLDDILAEAKFPRADVLKVDIEAAEAEVFRPGCGSWLDRVRTLVIELHGPACERAVSAALAGYRCDVSRSGELTVYRNLIPPTREGPITKHQGPNKDQEPSSKFQTETPLL